MRDIKKKAELRLLNNHKSFSVPESESQLYMRGFKIYIARCVFVISEQFGLIIHIQFNMFKYAYRLYRLLKITEKSICHAVNCVVFLKKCVGYYQ